ncbi:MAG TPA: response regulator [Anaeromyxobacteraceae bacterium]
MTAAATRSVLVVDDDPDICEVIQTVLEVHGYRVLTARDGVDALEQLRAGERPSMIILDLMMPRMNGLQFRDEQTRDPALRAIPVLVLTGDGRADAKAAALGVEGLRKPVELATLLDAVRRSSSAS